MQDLFAAIALVLVIEGLLWATMPEWMKSAALRVAQIDAGALRVAGLVTALVGVAAVWLIRG
jgi:hypothetical protein